MNILRTLTDWLVPISTFLIVVAAIIENSKKIGAKPITKFFKWIDKIMNEERDKKAEQINNDLLCYIKKSDEKDQELQQEIEDLHENMNDNERDRIRSEIFKYGRIARTHNPISTEEWRHIQDIYYKYHNKLKGNGQITEEYLVIKEFYESQYKDNKEDK